MSNHSISKFSVRSSTRRVGFAALLLFGALGAASAGAQDQVRSARSAFELRPYVGAYVPTGDQRDFLKDAVFAGAQASWRIMPMSRWAIRRSCP